MSNRPMSLDELNQSTAKSKSNRSLRDYRSRCCRSYSPCRPQKCATDLCDSMTCFSRVKSFSPIRDSARYSPAPCLSSAKASDWKLKSGRLDCDKSVCFIPRGRRSSSLRRDTTCCPPKLCYCPFPPLPPSTSPTRCRDPYPCCSPCPPKPCPRPCPKPCPKYCPRPCTPLFPRSCPKPCPSVRSTLNRDEEPSYNFLSATESLGPFTPRYQCHNCPWEADVTVSGVIRAHCTSTAEEVSNRLSGRFKASGRRYTTDRDCNMPSDGYCRPQKLSLGDIGDKRLHIDLSKNNKVAMSPDSSSSLEYRVQRITDPSRFSDMKTPRSMTKSYRSVSPPFRNYKSEFRSSYLNDDRSRTRKPSSGNQRGEEVGGRRLSPTRGRSMPESDTECGGDWSDNRKSWEDDYDYLMRKSYYPSENRKGLEDTNEYLPKKSRYQSKSRQSFEEEVDEYLPKTSRYHGESRKIIDEDIRNYSPRASRYQSESRKGLDEDTRDSSHRASRYQRENRTQDHDDVGNSTLRASRYQSDKGFMGKMDDYAPRPSRYPSESRKRREGDNDVYTSRASVYKGENKRVLSENPDDDTTRASRHQSEKQRSLSENYDDYTRRSSRYRSDSAKSFDENKDNYTPRTARFLSDNRTSGNDDKRRFTPRFSRYPTENPNNVDENKDSYVSRTSHFPSENQNRVNENTDTKKSRKSYIPSENRSRVSENKDSYICRTSRFSSENRKHFGENRDDCRPRAFSYQSENRKTFDRKSDEYAPKSSRYQGEKRKSGRTSHYPSDDRKNWENVKNDREPRSSRYQQSSENRTYSHNPGPRTESQRRGRYGEEIETPDVEVDAAAASYAHRDVEDGRCSPAKHTSYNNGSTNRDKYPSGPDRGWFKKQKGEDEPSGRSDTENQPLDHLTFKRYESNMSASCNSGREVYSCDYPKQSRSKRVTYNE